MKNRTLNRLYAFAMGYFWIPCPMCANKYGGHEWKEGDILPMADGRGKRVCPECGEYLRNFHALKGETE